MRSNQRSLHILKTAQEAGFVSIPKTAELLGVSVETIRRDVDALCEKNQLKKVYGGAVPLKSPHFRDEVFSVRLKQNQQGKIAICTEAARMIRDGSVVALDGGATTEFMATLIKNVYNVTFVVNSLRVATILVEKIRANEISGTVIMTGGQIIASTFRSYTMKALDTVDQYYYDIIFTSATALSATGASATATNPAVYVQHLMRRASTSVLVLESYKLGKHSVVDFAKVTDFDRIITDDQHPVPADILHILENSNTELTIVNSNGSQK